eukprot:CAMPEP_0117690948 /NCGR_PEP_ID=MMETSP0804-20121206/25428_1 /TAXON_ID=1074897 /ORGANISM="Tetraselmis astigmatica, Strain CCMP880" /LENGTH=123 /DNA_ID=CAMNT_0005504087 /DNA_START=422 /DNA_END=790 /DNA_ORIENTATION=-
MAVLCAAATSGSTSASGSAGVLLAGSSGSPGLSCVADIVVLLFAAFGRSNGFLEAMSGRAGALLPATARVAGAVALPLGPPVPAVGAHLAGATDPERVNVLRRDIDLQFPGGADSSDSSEPGS